MRTTGTLSRMGRVAMELHIPAARQAEGVNACVQDFAALLRRDPHAPDVVISSTVWMADLQ